jgi:Flp pilus assembly pilin Flp
VFTEASGKRGKGLSHPRCPDPPMNRFGRLWADERGQDLVEYTLLLAAIGLAGAAALIGMSASTGSIWTTVNSRLASAGGK